MVVPKSFENVLSKVLINNAGSAIWGSKWRPDDPVVEVSDINMTKNECVCVCYRAEKEVFVCFAKQQPGRGRQKFFATTYKDFIQLCIGEPLVLSTYQTWP